MEEVATTWRTEVRRALAVNEIMRDWTEVSVGDTWERTHQGRRGHVLRHDTGVSWMVDGGEVGDARYLVDARDACERALGLDAFPTPPVREGTTGVKTCTGIAATWCPRCGSCTCPRKASGERSLNGNNCPLHGPASDHSDAAAEHSGPLTLVDRIALRAPAEHREYLRERAHGVERWRGLITTLAEEGGDPAVCEQMLAEARLDAARVTEGALDVLRDLQRAEAFAEARLELAKEEVERARAERDASRRTVAGLLERVFRPLCNAVGEGPTKAIRAMTGRISVVRNPPSIEVDEGPDVLMVLDALGLARVKVEPDKAAIKAALADGREVPGARIVESTRIEVRG